VSPAAPFLPLRASENRFAGGNILGHWQHVFSPRSDLELRFYYDRARRTAEVVGEESSNTFDFDFQHHFMMGRQDIVWGIGYRFISSNSKSDSATPVRFTPKGLHAPVSSAFVQDEITLVPDRFRLTLATKFEDTIYGGIETQPSARLLWTPRDNQTVWGAISRAVRTTLHDDRGIRVNLTAFPTEDGTPAIVTLLGDPNTKSETLVAYEIGYRLAPTRKLSFDLATFYNSYDRLLLQNQTGRSSGPIRSLRILLFRFAGIICARRNLRSRASTNLNVTTGWFSEPIHY
jgi:iron complex outermembrane receptor protein